MKIPTMRPAVYAALLDILQIEAHRHGYALAVHGSFTRDLDIIACPWTDKAVSHDVLAEALREVVGGTIADKKHTDAGLVPNPEERAHGRQCWVIHLGGGPYLDVSIMPRRV